VTGRWIRVVAATLVLTAVSREALACPVCFGMAEGALVDGSNIGIFTLLAVTLAMLGAFAAFFVHLRRRERAMPRDEEATRGVSASVPTSAGGSTC
jgi:hypothetical protein